MMPLFIRSVFRKGWILWIFLGVLGTPLLFSYLVNRWFAEHEAAILKTLNRALEVPVTVRKIHYDLLRGILLEEVKVGGGADPILPSAIQISRAHIRPSFSFFPRPGFHLGKVVLEEPTFTLRADLIEMIKLGRFLNAAPQKDKRFGPLYLRLRLSSLKIYRGKLTFLSSGEVPFRQEFEGIQIYVGRRLLGGQRLVFKGHVAGNPKASFQIRADVKNPLPETVHLDLLFNCEEFATTYLKPHLGNRLDLPNEALTATIRLKVREGKTFVSKGKVAFPKVFQGGDLPSRLFAFVSSSLKYEVRGEIQKERWRFTKLILKTGGMTLKGDGELWLSDRTTAYTMAMASGKMPIQKLHPLLPELKSASGQMRLFLTFIGTKGKVSPSLDLILEDGAFQDKKNGLVWSKVDGRIRFSRDRLVVEELWAFLNNFPLRLKGSFQRSSRPHLVLELSTYPGQISILRPKNPLNASLRFIGNDTPRGWEGDLWLTHLSYGKRGEEKGKGVMAFHGLKTEGLSRGRFWRDLFEGRKIGCRFLLARQKGTGRVFSHLAIRRPSFFFSGEPGRIRCDLLEGTVNEGTLFLQGWADLRHFPNFSSTVTGSLSHANLSSLLQDIGKELPVTGRLSFEGTWHHKKEGPQFLGRFRVLEGVIGPTAALQQFSDQTGLEPLRHIPFREFSGLVAFRSGELDVDHVRLLGQDVEFSANVKVREERLSGALSAKFPASSVRETSNLKQLIRYIGEKGWVDFDFRIAGSLASPRIQWLTSEFKRKVEEKLSPSSQKQLAHEMEKLIR